MENEVNKEDKDKSTEAGMEESVVNNQNDKSAGGKGEPGVTRQESNQTQSKPDVPNVKQPKVSEAMIRELEEQNFIKLVSMLKNPDKHGNCQFYCEVCYITLEKMNEVKQHISSKGHRKNKKTKGPILTMKRIPQPSTNQTEALENMLESVYQKHGLDPKKDLTVRLEVKVEIQEIVQSHITGSYLTLYGSSLTCFGFKTSDVNLDLTLPEGISVPQGLLKLLDILQRSDKCVDVKDEFDLSVPQISFIHKKSGLTCHLSCGSKMVCKTSELLKHYAEINPVVHKLVVGFRFWAKSCCVDSKTDGGLAPYCFALMVIQFLQCTNPPVLPRLDVQEEISGDQLKFKTSNTSSLGLLWFKLFRFYCVEFEIDENVISIRVKQPFSRENRRWGHRRFAIEDPYMTGHNVSTVNSDKVFDYILNCMNTSFVYFGTVPKSIKKEKQSHQDSDEVEVYKDIESDKDKINDKPTAQKARSLERPKELHDGGIDDDDIFQMDDIDNGKGMATGHEDGSAKTQGRNKELTELEKKMENLNLKSQKEASQNSKSKKVMEFASQLSTAHDGSDPSMNQNTSKKLTSGKPNLAISYGFQLEVLSGGRKPEVQCQVCKKDGHLSSCCPDLRKPTLNALPPLDGRFVNLVTAVCSRARDVIAFIPEERKFRESVLWNLEDYIQEIFPGAQLHLFGSSMNGFGFKDSDLDICMTLDGKCKEDLDCISIINQLAKKLKQHRDCSSVVAITTAKVPIVKFYLRSVKREADISLYNVLALENTKMLATYAKLDDRVSILGYTLKLFAKVCDIGDASKGSLSSYAYILMLLHYLQKRDPPVIPVLQELYQGDTQPRNMIDGWNCWFYSDIHNLSKVWKRTRPNTESVGSLWIGFLRYYTETFDWEHEVVCCRRSKRLTKFEKMWTRHIFAIEDPFNLDHNLGAGISRKMGTFIRNALARGRERFGYPPVHPLPFHLLIDYFFHVDYLTDGCVAPSDRTCRVCGHIGHIARECPRLKKNRKEESRPEERSKLSNRPFAQVNTTPRKRAATAPILTLRKDSVTEKSENHFAESLPNTPLPKDAIQALNPLDGVKKDGTKSTDYDKAYSELPLKQETISNEKAVVAQSSNPGSNSSERQVPQTSHLRNDRGTVSQVETQSTLVATTSLPSAPHIDAQTTSINPQQESPRPGFGPVGQTTLANPGLPGNSLPYGVHLMTPEKFRTPPKGAAHTHARPFLSPQHLPGHVPGQVPDDARMFPQRQPIAIPSGYTGRPPLENTMNNAWPLSPQFEALYHSPHTPHARNIPGQPRERPRSVSESMASPGPHPEYRIPPAIGSSPPVVMSIGSPPPVIRNLQGNPFHSQALPHNVGSPIRHPSSLPSNLPMPHPSRTVEQAHLFMQQQPAPLVQSPPRTHPVMSKAQGGNMSPEVFFKIIEQAEQKQKQQQQQQNAHQPQNNQDIRAKPIPSSDVVLSHPVATPIFKPPKTADEKELFSKLDKVRGLWTSNVSDNGSSYSPQETQSGNGYLKGMPRQRESDLKEQGATDSPVDLLETNSMQVKEPKEIKAESVTLDHDQDKLSRGINVDDTTSTESTQAHSVVTNDLARAQNPIEGKIEEKPSTTTQPKDRKNERTVKETESPLLQQQLDDDVKRAKNSREKARQKSATDTSKGSRKKQGLLGDKPGEALTPGKKRQEKRHEKNMDGTDSSSSTSLGGASESEGALFDLRSYQKAFPSGDIDIENDSDRGNGSATQQKTDKKHNRNKGNGRRNQEESSPLMRRGKKKGGYSEEGVFSPGGGPAPKRRKSKEGLPTDSHCIKVESKGKGKSMELGWAVETPPNPPKKGEREMLSKNSRGLKDNRNIKKQSKEATSEESTGSFGDGTVEGNVAQTPQGKKGALAATPTKVTQVVKEDKSRGRRKQNKDTKDTTPAWKKVLSPETTPETTPGTSNPVQATPIRGEKNAASFKITRQAKDGGTGGEEQGKGASPSEKKESPTSRSEDSEEDNRGGSGGCRRKSKGRGRGRGRGRGNDVQSQPGSGNEGKVRPVNEKHTGSQEPRK